MQGPRRGWYSKQVLGTQDTRHNDLDYIIKGPPWPRLSWGENLAAGRGTAVAYLEK